MWRRAEPRIWCRLEKRRWTKMQVTELLWASLSLSLFELKMSAGNDAWRKRLFLRRLIKHTRGVSELIWEMRILAAGSAFQMRRTFLLILSRRSLARSAEKRKLWIFFRWTYLFLFASSLLVAQLPPRTRRKMVSRSNYLQKLYCILSLQSKKQKVMNLFLFLSQVPTLV